MNKINYYKVLGINEGATNEEIKAAYKKLAKQYHPDVNKSVDAESKFKEIQEACIVLLDLNKNSQFVPSELRIFRNIKKLMEFDISNMNFKDIEDIISSSFFEFPKKNNNTEKEKNKKMIFKNITSDVLKKND